MLPQEIIRTKRDGRRLTAGEIDDFVGGLTSGAVADAQAGAFAMAVFLKGMDVDECVALTREVLDLGFTSVSMNLAFPLRDSMASGLRETIETFGEVLSGLRQA